MRISNLTLLFFLVALSGATSYSQQPNSANASAIWGGVKGPSPINARVVIAEEALHPALHAVDHLPVVRSGALPRLAPVVLVKAERRLRAEVHEAQHRNDDYEDPTEKTHGPPLRKRTAWGYVPSLTLSLTWSRL